MPAFDFDVTVVGGGPAGSCVAIRCAEAGLSVLLLEQGPWPRERPGETLHPGVEPLLTQLGVAESVSVAGFMRHEGVWLHRDGLRRFSAYGRDKGGVWLGYQAMRSKFDDILLQRAAELNTEIHKPCTAIRPLISNGRVCGVVTSGGQARSRFTVDATGRRHWLTRELKGGISAFSPRLITRYGYVEGNCASVDDSPLLIADDNGWTWMAKINTTLHQWTRLPLDEEGFDRYWLPDRYQQLTPRGRARGADVTWRVMSEPSGPGYFTVGDASSVLDPASSHGVIKAIMSGMLVGHILTRVLCHGYPEPAAQESYAVWVRRWFQNDAARLLDIYRMLRLVPDWIHRASF